MMAGQIISSLSEDELGELPRLTESDIVVNVSVCNV